jgi:hypothetical protein
VVHALLKDSALDPGRLVVEGHGEAHPLVPNDTPQNRALNRRVEIIIRQDPEHEAAPREAMAAYGAEDAADPGALAPPEEPSWIPGNEVPDWVPQAPPAPPAATVVPATDIAPPASVAPMAALDAPAAEPEAAEPKSRLDHIRSGINSDR